MSDSGNSFDIVLGKVGTDLNGGLPPCQIWIDREGRWYYKGAEIIRPDIVRLFYRHLELDEKGRIIIDYEGQRCYVDVEDAPFVVEMINHLPPAGTDQEHFEIFLNDGTREILDPETLWIGDAHVPYCRVRGGRFIARFSRKAYYELAKYLETNGNEDRFYISVGKRRYEL